MTKTYRVVLIDPEARSINALQSDCSLDSIHKLVGVDTLDSFAIAKHADGGFDRGWIDDDGLMGNKPVHAFLLPISKDPMAGRCLIIGSNREGETRGAKLPLALLRREVEWLGLILPEVTWDDTEHGSQAIVTYSRVK